jgi:iron complex transport system substrate-binding protein
VRIASLLASATETVCALGLEEHLVAISHECDYPPSILDRPRVSRPRFDPSGQSSQAIDAAVRRAMREHGSVYVVDHERLRALAPDLLLAQAVCQVCAVPTSVAEDAARLMGAAVKVVSVDAHTLDQILESIRVVGRAAGAEEAAALLVERLESRLAAVAEALAGVDRPRVLAIEWLEPPFVPGHWVPEMIQRAGGRCAAGLAGRPSRETTWEALAALDPDVLVVMPCGFDLERSRAEAARYREELAHVAERALRSGRAFVVDGSAYFNRSGPRTVDGVEILARLLHPERLPHVSLEGRAEPLDLAGR